MAYLGNIPQSTRQSNKIVATAGQTIFGVPNGYTLGHVDVFLNGILLDRSDYTATDGSNVVLVDPAAAGDIITVYNYYTVDIATGLVNGTSKRQQIVVSTTGQTQFPIEGGYTPGYIDVYLNGIKMVAGDEIDILSGLYVEFFVAPQVSDVIDVVAYGTFEVANALTWADAPSLAGAKGSGGDQVFFENDQIVTANYAVTAGKNAMTAGPISINDNVTVTIPDGSIWTVI